MLRIIKDYFVNLITIIGSIFAIYLFSKDIFPKLDNSSIFAIIFIGIFSIVFFLDNVRLKITWGRSSKYGQVLSLISDGYSEIHNLSRKRHNVTDVVHAFQNLCDHLAKSFSLLTGTNCSVSIKILTKDNDDYGNERLKTISFCRDKNSLKRDKYSSSKNVKHWLEKNTDFLHLFEKIDSPEGRFFFSNQLPFRYNYQNTSFEIYKLPFSGDYFFIKEIIRYWRWPLPYKSTIVVPICPRSEHVMSKLVGFLCVDSPQILAFKKDYDVDLLCGVADGIYNTIREVSLNEQQYLSL